MVDHQRTAGAARLFTITLIIIIYLLSLTYAQRRNSECPIGFQLALSKTKTKMCYSQVEKSKFDKKFHGCVGNEFSMELYNSLILPKSNLTIWTDYKSAYPGGPFVDWSYTSSMGNRAKMNKLHRAIRYNVSDELCVAIDPVRNFTAVKCDEKHYRYCFVKPYSDNSYEILSKDWNDCIMFWGPQPVCLIHKTDIKLHTDFAHWEIMRTACSDCNSSLLGRGWIYANYYEKPKSYWPLNIMFNSSHKFLKYDYEDDKSEIPSKDWHFDNSIIMEPNKLLGAIHNNSWLLVYQHFTFDEVICERRRQLKYVSLVLSVNGNGIKLTINDTSLDKVKVKCFTDSLNHYPHTVEIDFFTSMLKSTKDGYYWCTHTDVKNYSISESNKLLFIKNVNSTNELYAMRITVPKYNYNLENKTIDEWKHGLVLLFKKYNVCSDEIDNLKDSVVIKRIYLDFQTVLIHARLCPMVKKDFRAVWSELVVTNIKPVFSCNNDINLNLYNKTVCHNNKLYTCHGNYNEGVTSTFSTQVCDMTSKDNQASSDAADDASSSMNMESAKKKVQQIKQVVEDLDQLLENEAKPAIEEVVDNFKNISTLIQMRKDQWEIPGSQLRLIENLGSKIETAYGSCDVVMDNIAIQTAKAKFNEPVRGMRIAYDKYKHVSNHSLRSKEMIIITDINKTKPLDKDELLVVLPKSVVDNNETQVTFVVYGKDSVFQKTDINGTYAISVVVNVKIKNDAKFLEGEVLEIHFATATESENEQNYTCAYWQYTNDDSGFWSHENCTFVAAVNGSLDTCKCNHLTHFAQVVVPSKLTRRNKVILEMLTIIGCSMSILGLLMVVLTALQFRSWRQTFTNKVWLQLSVSIFMLCVCFLAIVYARFDEKDFFCKVTGIVLHYTVLASLCWMLVVAVVSYKDLVIIFNVKTSHELLKASAFAWGLPCIIVVPLVSIAPQSYAERNEDKSPSDGAFCYPSGTAQWVSVYAPICLMLLANWTLFALILQSVFFSRKVVSSLRKESNEALHCASVSCTLAFLFGLPWSFGLFSFDVVIAYIFTILVTFQGFVLFIFIVIGNKKTRDLWLIKIKMKRQRFFSSVAYSNRSVVDDSARPNHHAIREVNVY